LKKATEETDNPDLRSRGYIYWRMLSTDPEALKQIVLVEKPAISGDSFNTFEGVLLDKLVANIGTLASVYSKPPEQFVKNNNRTLERFDNEFLEEDAGGEDDLDSAG
jgi:AP-1 complex subunit beta-1